RVVDGEDHGCAAVVQREPAHLVGRQQPAALVRRDDLEPGAGVDRALHAVSSVVSAALSAGVTTTGQSACRARWSDTEPSSRRWKPPTPRRPITIRSAFSAASSTPVAGPPGVTVRSTV